MITGTVLLNLSTGRNSHPTFHETQNDHFFKLVVKERIELSSQLPCKGCPRTQRLDYVSSGNS